MQSTFDVRELVAEMADGDLLGLQDQQRAAPGTGSRDACCALRGRACGRVDQSMGVAPTLRDGYTVLWAPTPPQRRLSAHSFVAVGALRRVLGWFGFEHKDLCGHVGLEADLGHELDHLAAGDLLNCF